MIIDVSSDNVTQPTSEMREVMHHAELIGYGVPEDLLQERLEALAVEITGKEAALLMPTGTQANLVAILCQSAPGQEVIVGPDSHIYEQELGGAGAIGGVMIRTWGSPGIPGLDTIQDAVEPGYRFPTPASPELALVCLENSHNASGGTVISPETMRELCGVIRRAAPRIHLDGARIFNSAAAVQCDVRELVDGVDSVMFCLDKCLSAPFGAMLCGTAEMVDQARKKRRMLGGYIRKIGIFTAAGLVALQGMRERIAEDNQRAASLGARLKRLQGISLLNDPVQTNLVMIDVSNAGVKPQEFVSRLKEEYKILCHVYGRDVVRIAVHRHIGFKEEQHIALAVEELLERL